MEGPRFVRGVLLNSLDHLSMFQQFEDTGQYGLAARAPHPPHVPAKTHGTTHQRALPRVANLGSPQRLGREAQLAELVILLPKDLLAAAEYASLRVDPFSLIRLHDYSRQMKSRFCSRRQHFHDIHDSWRRLDLNFGSGQSSTSRACNRGRDRPKHPAVVALR